MKRTTTIYWIVTGIFSAFMLFSAVPDALSTQQAKDFMGHLGYPMYFIPFIGIAKILGIIAILIPGYPRIKEWAYAGLAYDLIGALYSIIATDGFQPPTLIMLLPIIFLAISYTLYHQRLNASVTVS